MDWLVIALIGYFFGGFYGVGVAVASWAAIIIILSILWGASS